MSISYSLNSFAQNSQYICQNNNTTFSVTSSFLGTFPNLYGIMTIIDSSGNTLFSSVQIPGILEGIAGNNNFTWATNSNNILYQFDITTGTILSQLTITDPNGGSYTLSGITSNDSNSYLYITIGAYIVVVTYTSTPPYTLTYSNAYQISPIPGLMLAISYYNGYIWTIDNYNDCAYKIDSTTYTVLYTYSGLPIGPLNFVNSDNYIFVISAYSNTVTQIILNTAALNTLTIADPHGIDIQDNYLWVTDTLNGTINLYYVDNNSNTFTLCQAISYGLPTSQPYGLIISSNTIYVCLAQSNHILLIYFIKTNYYLANGEDLSSIFYSLALGGDAALPTYFLTSGNDLNTLFAKYVSGTQVNDTNFISQSQDLKLIFQNINNIPLPLYSISFSGTYYEDIDTINNTYTIQFITNDNLTSASGSITFNYSTNVEITIVGGGGGGGGAGSGFSGYYIFGGGGGGGGGVTIYNGTLSSGTYNITVGNGGLGGSTGSIGATSTFDIYSASGGGGGGLAPSYPSGAGGTGGIAGTGGGNGGKGGYSSVDLAQSGSDGLFNSSLNIYFGGGGGGGSYDGEPGGHNNGGLGGGDGAGFGDGSNNAQSWSSPYNQISYSAGYNSGSGWPSTGGGGAGANGNFSATPPLGNNGGSGIIIIYFTYP